MRILFVAFHNSIHTCRWINQLKGQGWDVHLFPSAGGDTHVGLEEVTVHELLYQRPAGLSTTVRIKGFCWPFPKRYLPVTRMALQYFPRMLPWAQQVNRLTHLIQVLKPDIVESKEIQHAGYLTLEAKERFKGKFPVWIVNNWGNDIHLFGQLAAHKSKIQQVLSGCDYYSCECHRDIRLARELGFKGEVLPVLPNCGGFDLERLALLRESGPTSSRRLIFVNGYQDWHGRALVALRALSLCADVIRRGGFRVALHSVNPDVKVAAELLANETGIPIVAHSYCTHDEIMRLHGQSRVHIGLAISDGIAITSLEALVMGAFPIQSCTSCADEWIVDGQTGFIVPPEDPEIVANAIRRALADDELVDSAAEINAKVAQERLAQAVITPKVIAMYERVAADKRKCAS